MCDRIQLRLMDRDVLSVDDIIGTTFLHMSHISRQGMDHGMVGMIYCMLMFLYFEVSLACTSCLNVKSASIGDFCCYNI